MNLRRRELFGHMAALAAMSGCRGVPFFGKRWYRGVLHCHTIWSNGRAFPEEAVEWYRSHGYHFLGLSDHNVFQDEPEKWVTVSKKFGWQTPTFEQLARYRTAHPDAEVRTDGTGGTQVRLRTFEELRARYEIPGTFALIPAMEMTHAIEYADGNRKDVHMNVINVPGVPKAYLGKGMWPPFRDKDVAGFIGEKEAEAAALAREKGVRQVFTLNHPIWQWYDVSPEDLIANPKVRYFEVCNNGTTLGAAPELPDDGYDTDRFWDVVNAFRARRGEALLYGVGNDDTHFYFGDDPWPMLHPGDAWCQVRAASPAREDIVAAMDAGEFTTCAGLEAEDVAFDRGSGTLTVAVGGAAGETRKITFIVSKRDFCEKPVRTLTLRHAQKPKARTRTVNIYEERVGQVAKTVVGKPGEPLRASYTLAADDLYVRARIESPKPPLCKVALHPKNVCCWTQPYTK